VAHPSAFADVTMSQTCRSKASWQAPPLAGRQWWASYCWESEQLGRSRIQTPAGMNCRLTMAGHPPGATCRHMSHRSTPTP
jgi:hypothetical protein